MLRKVGTSVDVDCRNSDRARRKLPTNGRECEEWMHRTFVINARRYQRYELETELTAKLLGAEHREIMRGRSLDINEGGIAGIFTTGWSVGTSVNLQFSVPIATAPVRVRAVLRNCTNYRYGFEFVDLAPQQRETVSRICRTLGLLQ